MLKHTDGTGVEHRSAHAAKKHESTPHRAVRQCRQHGTRRKNKAVLRTPETKHPGKIQLRQRQKKAQQYRCQSAAADMPHAEPESVAPHPLLCEERRKEPQHILTNTRQRSVIRRRRQTLQTDPCQKAECQKHSRAGQRIEPHTPPKRFAPLYRNPRYTCIQHAPRHAVIQETGNCAALRQSPDCRYQTPRYHREEQEKGNIHGAPSVVSCAFRAFAAVARSSNSAPSGITSPAAS